MDENGAWMTLSEYAGIRGISMSTARRYVKSGRLKTKLEQGKYFIFVTKERLNKAESPEKKILELQLEIELLRRKQSILVEENNDLKMLVQLYESGQMGRLQKANSLPEVPTL